VLVEPCSRRRVTKHLSAADACRTAGCAAHLLLFSGTFVLYLVIADFFLLLVSPLMLAVIAGGFGV
jgi:hypothetical protein